MKNKKQLLSEEVKQLQKIAGIKKEDLERGDINTVTNNQELSTINSKIQKLFPGAVPAEDESNYLGFIDPADEDEKYMTIAVYDWPTNPEKPEDGEGDMFDVWTDKIIVAKGMNTGKIAYYEISNSGEAINSEETPDGYL